MITSLVLCPISRVCRILADLSPYPNPEDAFYLEIAHVGPVLMVLSAVFLEEGVGDYFAPDRVAFGGLYVASCEGVSKRRG